MKISYFKFTWLTNKRDKLFQFRFQSLNGWTDVSFVTRARFDAMNSDQNEEGYAKTSCEQQAHFENSPKKTLCV